MLIKNKVSVLFMEHFCMEWFFFFFGGGEGLIEISTLESTDLTDASMSVRGNWNQS
jgi:hypothetical protein